MYLDYKVFFCAVFLLLICSDAEENKDKVDSTKSFQETASAYSLMDDDGFMAMDEGTNQRRPVQHVYNCGQSDTCVTVLFDELGQYYRFDGHPCGRCMEGLRCKYTMLDLPHCIAIHQCVPRDMSQVTGAYIVMRELPGQAMLLQHEISHCRPSWITDNSTTSKPVSQEAIFAFGRNEVTPTE